MSSSERIEYARGGGAAAGGQDEAIGARYLRAPGADPGPALLLVHAVFGLEPHIEDLSARFAAEGFTVLAPDLWSREGRPGPEPGGSEPAPSWTDDALRAAVEALPDRRALADLEAGLAWLAERNEVDSDRLAVCGFGMGGSLAFQLACTSRRLAAAVSFYGPVAHERLSANHPIQPLELGLNLSCPVLFHFGTEDASIPESDIARLEGTLGPFMKDFEVARWEGAGHGFLNDRRAGYHAPSASAAWQRTVEFLHGRLAAE